MKKIMLVVVAMFAVAMFIVAVAELGSVPVTITTSEHLEFWNNGHHHEMWFEEFGYSNGNTERFYHVIRGYDTEFLNRTMIQIEVVVRFNYEKGAAEVKLVRGAASKEEVKELATMVAIDNNEVRMIEEAIH